MCHQWFVTLSPYLEHVVVFETFPKAYQFQVLQQHPGIIFQLKSFENGLLEANMHPKHFQYNPKIFEQVNNNIAPLSDNKTVNRAATPTKAILTQFCEKL